MGSDDLSKCSRWFTSAPTHVSDRELSGQDDVFSSRVQRPTSQVARLQARRRFSARVQRPTSQVTRPQQDHVSAHECSDPRRRVATPRARRRFSARVQRPTSQVARPSGRRTPSPPSRPGRGSPSLTPHGAGPVPAAPGAASGEAPASSSNASSNDRPLAQGLRLQVRDGEPRPGRPHIERHTRAHRCNVIPEAVPASSFASRATPFCFNANASTA